MSSIGPRQIASQVASLATFSPVAIELIDAIDDETFGIEDLALIIQKDIALTARLLKLANSAYFGFSQEIDSVNDAVSRLGTSQVSQLATSMSVSNTFSGIPENLVSMQDFLSHSLRCAFAAQEIAKIFKLRTCGALFAAGLLHDIGQFVLYSQMPAESIKVLELSLSKYEGNHQRLAELEIFGFCHQEVGFELAKKWCLPKLIQECIALHHTPEETLSFCNEVAVINAANVLSVLIELRSKDLEDGPSMNKKMMNMFTEDPAKFADLYEHCEHKFVGSKDIYLNALAS